MRSSSLYFSAWPNTGRKFLPTKQAKRAAKKILRAARKRFGGGIFPNKKGRTGALIFQRLFFIYSVTKAKRDTGPKQVGDEKFCHPHTVDRSDKSVINIDRVAGSLWMAEFSVPHMFRACASYMAL
jgi:hypothetical protein